jgi:hypothetical protein
LPEGREETLAAGKPTEKQGWGIQASDAGEVRLDDGQAVIDKDHLEAGGLVVRGEDETPLSILIRQMFPDPLQDADVHSGQGREVSHGIALFTFAGRNGPATRGKKERISAPRRQSAPAQGPQDRACTLSRRRATAG